MGFIKKLKNNELVGGTDNTSVYPITSTKAVYDENNVSQDYLNKHITGDRIESNTIPGDKLADKAVTEEKVSDALMDKINSAAHGVTEEFETEVREALEKVVNTVSVNNGTPLEPDTNKNINITVPENLAELNTDEDHRTVTDKEKLTWSGKQDALTFDNVPTANSNNPVKSGGVYQAIQDIDVSSQISGKADKSEMSVVAGTGANADKTTITLKSGTSATVLTQHQDVSEFLREGEVFGTGDDSTASFNPYSDTVWNKQQTLSESQKQQIRDNIGVGAADNEDIQNVNGTLKFADRAYTATTSSVQGNMGYKILRKGSTFASQVTSTNTIYEIRYDYDLNGQTVTLPANCVLKFNGGKLVNGTLVGNGTVIHADKKLLFSNINISGTWNNKESYADWFNLHGNGTDDDTLELQNLFNLRGVIQLKENAVYCMSTMNIIGPVIHKNACVRIYSDTHIIGNNATILLGPNMMRTTNCNLVHTEDNICNVTIENVVFDGNYANNYVFDTSVTRAGILLRIGGGYNVTINRCTFTNGIGNNHLLLSRVTNTTENGAATKKDNATITNCLFKNGGTYNPVTGNRNTNKTDFSFIYCDFTNANISNNTIIQADLDTEDSIAGMTFDDRLGLITMNGLASSMPSGGIEIHNSNTICRDNNIVGCSPVMFIALNGSPEINKYENVTIINNKSKYCSAGVIILTTTNAEIKKVLIEDNIFDLRKSSLGIGFNPSNANLLFADSFIKGNYINTDFDSSYSENAAICFNTCKNIVIENNTITGPWMAGIALKNYSADTEDCVIRNNYISNPSKEYETSSFYINTYRSQAATQGYNLKNITIYGNVVAAPLFTKYNQSTRLLNRIESKGSIKYFLSGIETTAKIPGGSTYRVLNINDISIKRNVISGVISMLNVDVSYKALADNHTIYINNSVEYSDTKVIYKDDMVNDNGTVTVATKNYYNKNIEISGSVTDGVFTTSSFVKIPNGCPVILVNGNNEESENAVVSTNGSDGTCEIKLATSVTDGSYTLKNLGLTSQSS